MNKVRCKVTCVYKDNEKVSFYPVTTGSKENEEFFKYTPCGNINLTVLNENALSQFEVGKQYYVDFSLSE